MDIEKTRSLKKYWPVFAVTLGVVVIIIVLIMLMNGSTTTSGGGSSSEATRSLACTSESFDYPIYTYDYSTKKETVITATFNDDRLNRISLTHTLYYSSEEQIERSEAVNHAAMNISFANNNLEPDSFGANYRTLVSDPSALSLAMTMTTQADNIREEGAKYFMLQDVTNKDYTLEDLRTTYRNAGFKCEVNN